MLMPTCPDRLSGGKFMRPANGRGQGLWSLEARGPGSTHHVTSGELSWHTVMAQDDIWSDMVISMTNQRSSLEGMANKKGQAERVSCYLCWKLLGVVYLIHINVLFHLDVVLATHLKDNKFMLRYLFLLRFGSLVWTHVADDPAGYWTFCQHVMSSYMTVR